MTEENKRPREWLPPFPIDDQIVEMSRIWIEREGGDREKTRSAKILVTHLPHMQAFIVLTSCLVPEPIMRRLKLYLMEEAEGRIRTLEREEGVTRSGLMGVQHTLQRKMDTTVEQLNSLGLLLELDQEERIEVASATRVLEKTMRLGDSFDLCKGCKKTSCPGEAIQVGGGEVLDIDFDTGKGCSAREFAIFNGFDCLISAMVDYIRQSIPEDKWAASSILPVLAEVEKLTSYISLEASSNLAEEAIKAVKDGILKKMAERDFEAAAEKGEVN